MISKETFGTDFDGVITPHSGSTSADTSFFSNNYLRTPATPDSLEALARLNTKKYPGNMHIVSKCGPRMQAKTLHWMEHNGFYDITGMRPENIWFCLERPQKGPLVRQIGITAFVDDRPDVLEHIDPQVVQYLYGSNDPNFTSVASWQDILRYELDK